MDKINFILENIPDSYYKETDGNLYKILDSLAVQLDGFVEQLDEVKNSSYVDYAVGANLDKIAKLFNMRRFNLENDDAFRGRIKSKIPSFIGGGTIDAIKQVVQNYLGVEPVIIEHYKSGEGHPYFDKGVLNGFLIEKLSGLNIRIKSGTAYIDGTRITSIDSDRLLASNSTSYIKLNSNGAFTIDTSSSITTTQIMIGSVVTTTALENVTDLRVILNPEQHYITNTATITIQIPYTFDESKISLEDTKDILQNTKAAGIALLIKVIDTYKEIITIKDSAGIYFIVGFSGIGGNNLLGGV